MRNGATARGAQVSADSLRYRSGRSHGDSANASYMHRRMSGVALSEKEILRLGGQLAVGLARLLAPDTGAEPAVTQSITDLNLRWPENFQAGGWYTRGSVDAGRLAVSIVIQESVRERNRA